MEMEEDLLVKDLFRVSSGHGQRLIVEKPYNINFRHIPK